MVSRALTHSLGPWTCMGVFCLPSPLAVSGDVLSFPPPPRFGILASWFGFLPLPLNGVQYCTHQRAPVERINIYAREHFGQIVPPQTYRSLCCVNRSRGSIRVKCYHWGTFILYDLCRRGWCLLRQCRSLALIGNHLCIGPGFYGFGLSPHCTKSWSRTGGVHFSRAYQFFLGRLSSAASASRPLPPCQEARFHWLGFIRSGGLSWLVWRSHTLA